MRRCQARNATHFTVFIFKSKKCSLKHGLVSSCFQKKMPLLSFVFLLSDKSNGIASFFLLSDTVTVTILANVTPLPLQVLRKSNDRSNAVTLVSLLNLCYFRLNNFQSKQSKANHLVGNQVKFKTESNLVATWTKAHGSLQGGSGFDPRCDQSFQIVATKPSRSGLLIGGSHPVFGGMAAW